MRGKQMGIAACMLACICCALSAGAPETRSAAEEERLYKRMYINGIKQSMLAAARAREEEKHDQRMQKVEVVPPHQNSGLAEGLMALRSAVTSAFGAESPAAGRDLEMVTLFVSFFREGDRVRARLDSIASPGPIDRNSISAALEKLVFTSLPGAGDDFTLQIPILVPTAPHTEHEQA
ncbi:MAG: hypothetical protein GF418_17050, partial [Chitinivibrionales bacterium]|nr:hypothetical protein [Chitinivibrionales bacterium]MBD3397329.1 hypothetical protein [Chitinivibrionales bacterium]